MTEPSASDVPSDPARAAARLQRARLGLATGLRAGRGGARLTQGYSDEVSSLVSDIARVPLLRARDRWGALALTAVGGLGRRELAPHSDIDLVVVSASVPPEGDPQFDAFVRELVHPLWDAGMRAGVMVHDPGTWLAEAADDLTLCTSLLDVRCLGGEAAIVEGLRRDAFEHLFGDRRRAFLLRLEQDIAERHTRYGGTVFLVEPDLKYGPGGLRDLAALQWSLMATHQTMDFAELTRRGVLRPRMASLLTSSRDVLLRLRVALQLAAKRSQDRLVFQYQELLPPLVGSLDEGPHDDAVLVEAIEIAMQEYYRAARDLLRYGARVRERCRPRLEGDASSVRRIDERFAVIDGRLRLEGADALRDTPVLALEALALARDQGLELSGETFDAIAEASATPAAEGLSREPEAQRQLFDLLCEPNDLGTPSSLELAVELGLLERVVPEFAPIRGRMQHDPYHVYTVDQHTLGAIAMLKRLARGEHNKDFPLATAVHLEIDDPRVLYLATLCHDMGKALPGDQCDVGAVVARTVAQRCGLPPVEAERCAKLVGEHLSMPLLSQKRDLSDPLLIAEFADTIGDRGTLKELYLLSLVDMAQVRPGNLTSWKLTLLDELYLQTCAHLQRGTVGARLPPRRRGELDGMPGRYYSLYHLDMRRHHARLVERLATEDRQAMLEVASGSGALRLTLVARDRPGLLAQATAIVDDHGLEILAADVFSAPGSTPVALDVFRVAAKDGPEHGVDVATVTAMEQALQRGLDRQFLQTPLPPRRGRRWHRPPVPTRIAFDRDPAGERSIVEVETEAGSDVLRRITLAFAAEGVSILLARCNTEAERAANVFYVPTLDDVQQRQLSGRLRRYLEPT